MTPGPDKILKLPRSQNLVKIKTIGSGNTFGARLWTDGRMHAPMLPDNPRFRRNPNTGETFWIEECETVAQKGLEKVSKYPEVPYAEDAGEQDLLDELRSNDLDPEKEKYVRTRLWWLWNEPARDGDDPFTRPSLFDANLRKLVDLLDRGDPTARIMAAEALRQLGDHAGATDLLDHPFPKGYQTAVALIRCANDERDTRLREIV